MHENQPTNQFHPTEIGQRDQKEPNRTEPNRTEPDRTEPNQTKPNQKNDKATQKRARNANNVVKALPTVLRYWVKDQVSGQSQSLKNMASYDISNDNTSIELTQTANILS